MLPFFVNLEIHTMATELFNMSISETSQQKYNFRDTLIQDFESLNGFAPFKGGWGYTAETAIVLDETDFDTHRDIPFTAVTFKDKLVQNRIYEELIIYKTAEERFEDISWDLVSRTLMSKGDTTFELLKFKVTCYRVGSKELIEKDQLKINADYTQAEHERYKDSIQYFYYSNYYFDVSSFAE